MRKISVTINKDGTTTTDFEGFTGPSCLSEADKLREKLALLGIVLEETNFTPKPELSTSEDTQTTRRQTAQEG